MRKGERVGKIAGTTTTPYEKFTAAAMHPEVVNPQAATKGVESDFGADNHVWSLKESRERERAYAKSSSRYYLLRANRGLFFHLLPDRRERAEKRERERGSTKKWSLTFFPLRWNISSFITGSKLNGSYIKGCKRLYVQSVINELVRFLPCLPL